MHVSVTSHRHGQHHLGSSHSWTSWQFSDSADLLFLLKCSLLFEKIRRLHLLLASLPPLWPLSVGVCLVVHYVGDAWLLCSHCLPWQPDPLPQQLLQEES